MAHIPRVLCPHGLIPGGEVQLDSDRAHHLYTVMRRRAGDAVRAWDGQGQEANAAIIQLDHRKGSIRIADVESCDRESPLSLVLVQAVGRGDRFDDAMIAAVEVGATAIQPIWTEFGLPAMKAERMDKKLRSWQIQLLGAAEQAERSRLPDLRAPLSLRDWLAQRPHGVFLHPTGAALPRSPALAPQQEFHVAVGPEGGFSENEVQLAQQAGLPICQLGPRILRMEHAGPLALAVLQAFAGDY